MAGAIASLLDRLVKQEISVQEFLRTTDELSEDELKWLLDVLRQKAAEQQSRAEGKT